MSASSVDREYNNVVREKPSIEECRELGNVARGKPYCQRSLHRFRGSEVSPLDFGPNTAEIEEASHGSIRNSQKANSSLADGDDKINEKGIDDMSANNSIENKETLRWKAEANKLRHENIVLKEEALRTVRTDPDTPLHLNVQSEASEQKSLVYSATNLSISLPTARSKSESTVQMIDDLYNMGNKNKAEVRLDNYKLKCERIDQPQRNVAQVQKGPLTPSSRLKLQLQLLKKLNDDFVDIEKILWEGGLLWKVPFNGKGIPESRIVALKRSASASIYSKAVRIIDGNEGGASVNLMYGKGNNNRGEDGTIEGYIVYPPTLVWYDADSDRPDEIKNARELVLAAGSHIVTGHSTPAFSKLISKKGPIPRPDLCFSVVTDVRTLDVAAETTKSSGDWKRALRAFLVAIYPDSSAGTASEPGPEPRPESGSGLKVNKLGDGIRKIISNDDDTKVSCRQYGSKSSVIPSPPSYPPRNRRNVPDVKDNFILQNTELYQGHQQHHKQQYTYHEINRNFEELERKERNLQKEKMQKQMFSAAKNGDYEMLESAFLAGVPANLLESGTSDTALLISCRAGNADLVRLCLYFGAKNDPHPDFGETALHIICRKGHYNAAIVILEAAKKSQANHIICNLLNDNGETPLHLAAMEGHIEIFQLLLYYGGDILKLNNQLQSVAHLCSITGKEDCLRLILDLEGDTLMDARDNTGNSPLHLAGKCKYSNIIMR